MNVSIGVLNGHNGGYFDRVPEKLVLEGYRYWLAGYETGSVTPWEMSWTLYTRYLGGADGRRALGELSHLVRTLRLCAACPLASFPFDACHICRDECLVLGIVAALQHEDADAETACLSAMSCPARRDDIREAASSFAGTLAELHQHLLPIPAQSIKDVLQRTRRSTMH